jgi:hypothetical protein
LCWANEWNGEGTFGIKIVSSRKNLSKSYSDTNLTRKFKCKKIKGQLNCCNW